VVSSQSVVNLHLNGTELIGEALLTNRLAIPHRLRRVGVPVDSSLVPFAIVAVAGLLKSPELYPVERIIRLSQRLRFLGPPEFLLDSREHTQLLTPGGLCRLHGQLVDSPRLLGASQSQLLPTLLHL